MGRKKTRFHSRWRLDQDYLAKLSPDERAWLEQFNAEYYRGEFEGEPLHPRGEARREIYRRFNAAARDLVTASSDQIAEATAPATPRACFGPRFYGPADYRFSAAGGSPEDALLEELDAEQDGETSGEMPLRR